jgi:hypothetical protein
MGRELDVKLPTTTVTNEYLTAGREMGIGDYDFAILFDVLAKMSGVVTDRVAKAESVNQ